MSDPYLEAVTYLEGVDFRHGKVLHVSDDVLYDLFMYREPLFVCSHPRPWQTGRASPAFFFE